MLERFNDEARLVVVDAQVHANELGHDHVGVEHLLLGLLAPHAVAGDADLAERLAGCGLTSTVVRSGLADEPAHLPPAGAAVVFTEGSERSMRRARGTAASRNASEITVDDLAVAVLDEPAVDTFGVERDLDRAACRAALAGRLEP